MWVILWDSKIAIVTFAATHVLLANQVCQTPLETMR